MEFLELSLGVLASPVQVVENPVVWVMGIPCQITILANKLTLLITQDTGESQNTRQQQGNTQ